MPLTKFNPAKNGFQFRNGFINVLPQIPGLKKIETLGRCGGMSYSALDYFYLGIPVPKFSTDNFPQTGIPSDGTRLADYIYRRQVQSFMVPAAIKFVLWTVLPDKSLGFLKGVRARTLEDELPKLKKCIDRGDPVVLGLIVATKLINFGKNHQVVAYGYEVNPTTQVCKVYLYDSNYPGEEIFLTVDPAVPYISETKGEKWRGFFVQDYSPKNPPFAEIALSNSIKSV